MWTLALIGAFVACGLMLWAASRIEPHWASKDGGRFTCRVQRLGQHDLPQGMWREMRATIEGDDLVISAKGLRARDLRGTYSVLQKSPEPPKGKAIFLCSGPERVVLRVPANSRAVPLLERLADRSNK